MALYQRIEDSFSAFAKCSGDVFYDGKKVDGAYSVSFEVLGHGYGKSSGNVLVEEKNWKAHMIRPSKY